MLVLSRINVPSKYKGNIALISGTTEFLETAASPIIQGSALLQCTCMFWTMESRGKIRPTQHPSECPQRALRSSQMSCSVTARSPHLWARCSSHLHTTGAASWQDSSCSLTIPRGPWSHGPLPAAIPVAPHTRPPSVSTAQPAPHQYGSGTSPACP